MSSQCAMRSDSSRELVAQVDAGLRRRQLLAARHATHLQHPVDVRAAQVEHLVHADVAGDTHELGAQPFEHRAFGVGALVLELQHHAAAGVGSSSVSDARRVASTFSRLRLKNWYDSAMCSGSTYSHSDR